MGEWIRLDVAAGIIAEMYRRAKAVADEYELARADEIRAALAAAADPEGRRRVIDQYTAAAMDELELVEAAGRAAINAACEDVDDGESD